MKEFKIYIMYFLFLCSSCQHLNENVRDIKLFDPNFGSTLKDLEQKGFKPMDNVDIVLIGRSMNDTLIYYQFEDNIKGSSTPTAFYMKVPLESIQSIDQLVAKNSSIIVAEKEDKYIKYFYIKNLTNNLYFEGSVKKQDSSYFLIKFDYPNWRGCSE